MPATAPRGTGATNNGEGLTEMVCRGKHRLGLGLGLGLGPSARVLLFSLVEARRSGLLRLRPPLGQAEEVPLRLGGQVQGRHALLLDLLP